MYRQYHLLSNFMSLNQAGSFSLMCPFRGSRLASFLALGHFEQPKLD